MKIGIVGNGVVGSATARCFMEWGEVRVYDQVDEKRTHTLNETLGSDVIFVCLPTPQTRNGLGCNLAPLTLFFHSLSLEARKLNWVLRSTVPIGTTRNLRKDFDLPNLVHSPEFLTARCSFTDAQCPSRMIIGGAWEGDNQSTACGNVLLDLYRRRFTGIPIHLMSSDESESVKLFLNGFFAVKVAYFNEVYALAKRLDLDWGTIMAGVMSDGRIAHSHTKVPGPDGKLGYGGTCLPKDLANLASLLQENSCEDWMTTAALNWRQK